MKCCILKRKLVVKMFLLQYLFDNIIYRAEIKWRALIAPSISCTRGKIWNKKYSSNQYISLHSLLERSAVPFRSSTDVHKNQKIQIIRVIVHFLSKMYYNASRFVTTREHMFFETRLWYNECAFSIKTLSVQVMEKNQLVIAGLTLQFYDLIF